LAAQLLKKIVPKEGEKLSTENLQEAEIVENDEGIVSQFE
jgi:hypothetical protein